jgi:uncharacterized protein (UPF0548 family)
MFSLRPNFDRALDQAETAHPGDAATWLEQPPARAHRVSRSIRLPKTASIEACERALFGWEIHRKAGLRVTASGPAEMGATVVLGIRLGPVWAVAPCRVVARGRAEFVYATLPGHPERGAERFAFIEDAEGIRFEVSAVSEHAFWGSRLTPALANWVQAGATQRYLEAGAQT